MIKGNKLLFVLSVMCAISVIVMIVALCIPKKQPEFVFTPPPFDENAVTGTPTVPENMGYSFLYQDGMSFKVGLCGKINIVKHTAEVYFTNVSENTVWLKARFYDSKGNILGESGLIKPGEYLKSIELNSDIKETDTVKLKIMSYEPETYNSVGAITLTPKITISQ